jgi:heat shock protein HslJ
MSCFFLNFEIMRSLASIAIIFYLALILNSCKTTKKSVAQKLPEITLNEGSYYVQLPNFDNEFIYFLVLSIDTSGNFEYLYQSGRHEPNPVKVQGKTLVQYDSTFVLSNPENNQTLKVKFDSLDSYIIVEKGKNTIFKEGIYKLIDATGYSYSTYDVLMAESGFYFIAEDNSENWSLHLSEAGKYYLKFPENDKVFSGHFSSREFEFSKENEISFELMIESKSLKVIISEEKCELNHKYKTIVTNEALTLNGCGRFTKPQLLIDGTWKLTELDGKSISELKFPTRIPTITVQSTGRDLIGNNGCNNIFGYLKYKADSIFLVNALGSTRMFCEKTDDLLFMEKFPLIKRFRVNGKILELWSDNELLFRFKRM